MQPLQLIAARVGVRDERELEPGCIDNRIHLIWAVVIPTSLESLYV